MLFLSRSLCHPEKTIRWIRIFKSNFRWAKLVHFKEHKFIAGNSCQFAFQYVFYFYCSQPISFLVMTSRIVWRTRPCFYLNRFPVTLVRLHRNFNQKLCWLYYEFCYTVNVKYTKIAACVSNIDVQNKVPIIMEISWH